MNVAVSSTGEVAGSVTGGCVEPAVIREATEVLNGLPGRICRYGLTDDEGFDVGLSCGGSMAFCQSTPFAFTNRSSRPPIAIDPPSGANATALCPLGGPPPPLKSLPSMK